MATKLYLAVFLLILSACDTGKKMDDMHRSTVKMQKTTDDMSGETKEMNQTTSTMADQTKKMVEITSEMQRMHILLLEITKNMNGKMETMVGSTDSMHQLTSELYHIAKHGGSMQMRRESLNAIRDTKVFSRKVAEAMKYFMGFEFQIWMGTGEDDLAKRDQLFQLSLMEFFAEVEEFVNSDDLVIDPFKDIGLNQSFLALAVGAESIDQRQIYMNKRLPEFQPVSMLDLMQMGLIAGEKIKKGEASLRDFPDWISVVLDNESMARKVIQARASGYILMFVGRAAGIQHGLGDQVKTVLLKKSWKVDLAETNIATASEFDRYLEEAKKARDFLVSMGASKHNFIDNSLEKIILKGVIVNAQKGKDIEALGLADKEQFIVHQRLLKNFKSWQ